VKNYEEALVTADDTEFGRSDGVATTSPKNATHFERHGQAGMVMVNLPTADTDYHEPFGGRRGSNDGPREQGRCTQKSLLLQRRLARSPEALADFWR